MAEIIKTFTESVVTSQYSLLLLFLIAFAESSFFPIPPDTILIPMSLINPALALWYGLLTTVGSVLGGMFGYGIGRHGGKPIVSKFISDEKLYNVKLYYNRYDVWAIVLAAVTPLPYKIFTISAGLFDLSVGRFFIASSVGRGLRFFLVTGLIYLFGPSIKPYLVEYFDLIIIGFAVLLVAGFLVANIFLKSKSARK